MNMAKDIQAEINDLRLIHDVSWTMTHSPHFYSRITFDSEDDLKSEAYMVVVLHDNILLVVTLLVGYIFLRQQVYSRSLQNMQALRSCIPPIGIQVNMNTRKNINSTLPEGKYHRLPPNRVHVDKKKYNRKRKHKDDIDS